RDILESGFQIVELVDADIVELFDRFSRSREQQAGRRVDVAPHDLDVRRFQAAALDRHIAARVARAQVLLNRARDDHLAFLDVDRHVAGAAARRDVAFGHAQRNVAVALLQVDVAALDAAGEIAFPGANGDVAVRDIDGRVAITPREAQISAADVDPQLRRQVLHRQIAAFEIDAEGRQIDGRQLEHERAGAPVAAVLADAQTVTAAREFRRVGARLGQQPGHAFDLRVGLDHQIEAFGLNLDGVDAVERKFLDVSRVGIRGHLRLLPNRYPRAALRALPSLRQRSTRRAGRGP